MPRAEPVSAIRVVGSDRILLAAAPAQVVKRGDQSYRMPEETFDATQRAADFDALALARLPRRWAGQRPVVAAAGKVQQLFQPAVTVPDLEPADRIVTVTIGEETHAYPVLLLYSVAGVLDLVGGRQVFVTWSPVTQVARCLVPQVDDKPLELQDAGLVYRGNELLFDVGTGSLWDTLTGAALTGPMVGKTVQVLPSDVLPWGQLKQDQPTANVLVLPGTTFDKQVRDRVEAYLNSPAIPVPVVPPKATPAAPAAPAAESGEAPQAAGQGGPPPKAFVLGIAVGKESRAYDLGALFSAGKKELKDAVGGRDFEITVTSPRTAQATSGGKPVDAPVMLYFGWKQAHPETTVYGAAAPAAAPEPPAAP